LALVINNKGQVAGTSNLAGDINFHAFLWDRGTLIDLGTLGGSLSTTLWINDGGDVVGIANTSGDQFAHAFLWAKGKISDLGTLDGDCFSLAEAINSKGQIVGLSSSCETGISRAVLWEKGAIIDLSTSVPANTNLSLTEAFNINERGEILVGCLPPGVQNGEFGGHDCLLIPSGNDD
jgi:probable HAF family extracellular repeat protein